MEHHLSDFLGRKIFIAGFDHILLAIHHEEVAVLVESFQVTAVKPAELKLYQEK
jgi:hypothetical protein